MREQTFVQEARRRQLVACAIEVVADVGLAAATLTRIARRAGISRGLVNYHFRDREELLEQVVAEVYRVGTAEVGPAVVAAASPRERVLAFVSASVAFYHAYPHHLAALGEIDRATRRATGGRDAWAAHARELTDLRTLLAAGQDAGQFRDFDVDVMAAAVRAVLDSALPMLAAPGADPDAIATELCQLVDHATEVKP
ncbi:TetR/AcrR family transcriptional regulator [Actinophytocola oryzae]|uniref:TetR family transcriptional regulator n=1 Tax=Actinophytocola oryzae TaxID=502181 RepID=A0A4R7UP42_9PSEU|nr:TetR/AcrR family transcriptional regulator [Actinophytocola oryzae]TDV35312.1 TetR family transcriptional regulator [Actinophytocola oryzae]